MFSFAHIAKNLLDNSQTQAEILSLAVIFFLMTFLVATQDVVVDGWAISLLSKKNVHWQAICNGTGQTSGYYVGNICFVILESAKFCNSYVRPLFGLASQDHGIITLESLCFFNKNIFIRQK
jgi:PAT family acetyl-CoA transporter-like MFS transporter 1